MAPKKKKANAHRAVKTAKEGEEPDEDAWRQQLEEAKVMQAVYQEDYRLLRSGPCLEYALTLRPHVSDNGKTVPAVVDLIITYGPAYPHRPPRIKVIPKEAIRDEAAHNLQEILVLQAAGFARERRVMVYNLADVAQEFLAEHNTTDDSIHAQMQKNIAAAAAAAAAAYSNTPEQGHDIESWHDSVGVGLFSDWLGESGESEALSREMQLAMHMRTNDAKQKVGGRTRSSHTAQGNAHETRNKSPIAAKKLVVATTVADDKEDKGPGGKGGEKVAPVEGRLPALVPEAEVVGAGAQVNGKEEDGQDAVEGGIDQVEDEDNGDDRLDRRSGSVSVLLRKLKKGVFKAFEKVSQGGSRPWSESDDMEDEEFALSPANNDLTIQKDLLLGQLLRLACSARGPLPHSFSVLANQLHRLGVLPQWEWDLLINKPGKFEATFRRVFKQKAAEAQIGLEPATRWALLHFWKASEELHLGTAKEITGSRYLNDFQEETMLGRGGFGRVMLCVNKLDGRRYAVKKIACKDQSQMVNSKIVREVATLSRLQHHHVVRYYQAWFETGGGTAADDAESEYTNEFSASMTPADFSDNINNNNNNNTGASRPKSSASMPSCLYIQMEYCPRTLRQLFETVGAERELSKEDAWRMFRQIVEGLVHIHAQGVVHRDLTPNNIFFSPTGEVKIGDFGLAKFTSWEPTDRTDVPVDHRLHQSLRRTSSIGEGTGQVGTFFYTAPEIEHQLPHIDEKVDMYSLGIVCFELWHPFSTGMERVALLSALRSLRALPEEWALRNPQQAQLIRWLVAESPQDRPTAAEVLRSELLPPRMEDESLSDILRTIQRGDDSSVCERVLGAVFDEQRFMLHKDTLKPVQADLPLPLMMRAREDVLRAVQDICRRHGAQPTDSHLISFVDRQGFGRSPNIVKLMDPSGNLLSLRHGTRVHFAEWLASHKISSFKRYELSQVYRKGIGRSVPREFFQADFDIVGGGGTVVEAEVIKVAVEIVQEFPAFEGYEIRLNHCSLLNAVWSWLGVRREDRSQVAKVLAEMSAYPLRSTERKQAYSGVLRQLKTALKIPEPVLERLQTVERRLSGEASEALPRYRGALPQRVEAAAAMDELTTLLTYLRTWGIKKNVMLDALMAPSEDFYDGIFFQIHLGSSTPVVGPGGKRVVLPPLGCVAVGGSYNALMKKTWPTALGNPPGAVGLSVGLQKLLASLDPSRDIAPETTVMVCSRGGGGLLKERMEVAAELWASNIKAEMVSTVAPSMKEQYEYASERGAKWLVIISQEELSANEKVKVRALDSRAEESVPRGELAKFLTTRHTSGTSVRRKGRSQS